MPRLSVVVPFHNVEAYAPDTLCSLAENADPDTEFLLVDDCSTDGTGELLDHWERKIPQARIVRHETTRGVAQARNSGIDAAEGDYITFLDGDDWYRPGYLRQLLTSAEELDCDFVRTDHVQSTERKREIRRAPARLRGVVMDPRDGIAPPDRETMVDYPFVWAGAYRRHLFDDGGMRFATDLRTAEDRLWIWRLHLKARSYAALGLHGVFYRRGVTTSLTQILDERQLDFIPAYATLLEEVGRDPEAERFLPKVVRTYCAMIAFHSDKAHLYEAGAARRLARESREALAGMPQDILEKTLTSMDEERAGTLRRLRAARKAA